ncbi:DotD/TraH family lipoprotein [Zooshikella marina]|uniref:DotD/TraH family lipoprotein n=1 Tax=Zooshikella ganghwensis TaxID=202772 RepID=UPI001BB0C1A7|nr:DotD/TraH family lipoprotein [Zooshikella ganghwensis]MBU2708700.1 DotD/TraH family lipoprotein [Zooshikella ganghwensis]
MVPRRYNIALILGCSLFVGCASKQFNEDTSVVDQLILDSAKRIQKTQTDLYHAAAINKKRGRYNMIMTNHQPINIAWDGDALQLLNKLARDRGLKFAFTGVRQPLPVSISEENTTFNEVIRNISAQVGYRANVAVYSDKLLLQYNPPKKQ